mgnify:CR=1 FL=1
MSEAAARIPTSDLCLLRQPEGSNLRLMPAAPSEDGTPNGVSVIAISSRTTNRLFRQHWRHRLRGLRLNNQTAHDHYAAMSEAAARIPTSNLCLSHHRRMEPPTGFPSWRYQAGPRTGCCASMGAGDCAVWRCTTEPRTIIRPPCRKPLHGFQPPAYVCRTNRRIPTSGLCLSHHRRMEPLAGFPSWRFRAGLRKGYNERAMISFMISLVPA